MKQFFLEFIGLFIVDLVLYGLISIFFPEDILPFDVVIYTALGASAVYCIAKALENGYGEDAVED